MLSPEVFNFPAPESQFQVEKFEGKVPLTNNNINNFHYSHLVTLIFPESSGNFGKLENFEENSVYYKIYDLSLSDLVDVRFISSFVRSGKLTLLSLDKRIDCDNCIGLTPNGQLHLNLTKETYESLGIDGTVSHFVQKLKSRYIVTIDLAEDKLLHNKKKLAKLKSRLQSFENFTVLVSWQPPTEDVCPSSIAKYLADSGYKVKECRPAFNEKTVTCEIPSIDLSSIDRNEASEFAEWLGMVSLGGSLSPDLDDYLSSYVAPSVSGRTETIKCLQWRGFFTSSDVSRLIEGVMFGCNPLATTWTSVYVQGFDDCPVAWGNEEQHYFTNGDNANLIIFNNARGVICSQKCSRKRYK
ncbi:ribonuclease P protein subunit p40 isoform X2 [Leptinotarsa decemlineata]|uniref:ribonuclease P protein subunit p40 isoform X2 n=1 Tax=Leptinotarsa decemlineata TaxID=7539 RepID=UPI000C254744|nr:ribonuclease P protein subunit p40-like [Leptinotarsa decemlineata]